MRTYRAAIVTIVLVVSLTKSSAPAADPSHRVTVSAGKSDRVATVVPLELPGRPKGEWTLRDEAGQTTCVQTDPAGRGWFVVTGLKAGESKSYTLQDAPAAARDDADSVQVVQQGGVITVSIDGREAFRYQGEKSPLPAGYEPQYQRGGYIHPVYTPSGKLVTDDYPHNHKHHRGIWAPWTKTLFEGRDVDFWNMKEKKGTVEYVSAGHAWGGPVAGGFRARHRFMDLTARPEPKAALNEEWEVTAYRVGAGVRGERPALIFDLKITQTCATDSPLILPKFYYGGLGFRGHKHWDGKENAFYLTSAGKDRSNGNETRGRWCHVGGRTDGQLAGVAILDHPGNFRHPQPMRLHPSEPFFCYAPSQLGDWKIEPGKLYTARYRFVVADGPPDKAELDRLWADFADPPEVVVK